MIHSSSLSAGVESSLEEVEYMLVGVHWRSCWVMEEVFVMISVGLKAYRLCTYAGKEIVDEVGASLQSSEVPCRRSVFKWPGAL